MRRDFKPSGNGWLLDASDLPNGLYRIEVRLADPLTDGSHTRPVHDLFEISPLRANSSRLLR